MAIRITVKQGQCAGKFHEVGQSFVVEDTTPEGMCLGAWNAIAPYVTTLRCGGNFPWESQEGVTTIHCPDPNGITLEVKRVESANE
jgi:uncharacterized repeat protein (TIGR04076 family)